MKPGVQSAIGHEKLHKYGCLFLSILQCYLHAIGIDGYEPPEDQLANIYDEALHRGLIDADCTVQGRLKLWRFFGGRFGRYVPVPEDVRIIRNTRPGYEHFTARIDGEDFDPLDPARKDKQGRLIAGLYEKSEEKIA